MRIQPGGSATIYGIDYQILGSLLELTEVTALEPFVVDHDLSLESVRLILEPANGGGDLVLERDGVSRVIQYKARSDRGAWSLRDVMRKVLPDLYKGVDAFKALRYEFVTEGHGGDWKEVEDWMRSLGARPEVRSGDDVLGLLREDFALTFRGSLSGDTGQTTLSEKEFFLAIVAILRGDDADKTSAGQPAGPMARIRKRRGKPRQKEPLHETHLKVWRLLSGFVPVWNQTPEVWRERVRKRLRPLGVTAEEIEDKVDVLVQDLHRHAIVGGERIDPKVFLRRHGLDAESLMNWSPLVVRARESLSRAFRVLRYDADEDVRASRTYESEQRWWVEEKPFAVLSGPSGQGKTWRLAAMANSLSEEVPVAVLRSSGDAATDKEEIERIVSQDIRGLSRPRTLEETANEVRRYAPDRADRWLCAFIDNVGRGDIAQSLWNVLGGVPGVRVVISTIEGVATAFAADMPDQVDLIDVPDFDEAELLRYVADGDLVRFHEIDPSVRKVIERPLLASLYRDLSGGDWRPENEYALYHAHFESRLSVPLRQKAPTLLPRLRAAVIDAWGGGEYPWRIEQLEALGFTDERISRLVSMGWFVADERERYRVWHDRLLEWQMAEAVSRGIENGELEAGMVAKQWRASFSTEEKASGPVYRFWAMDLVWQLAQRGASVSDALDTIIQSGEDDYRLREALYGELLPTVGAALAPALNRRLMDARRDDRSEFRTKIPEILARYEAEETVRAMTAHLLSGDWQLRNAASRYFGKRPSTMALGPLWARYCRLVSDKSQGYEYREDEPAKNAFERRDFYDALVRCAVLDPDWIERRIHEADATTEYVAALAGILRQSPEGQARWTRLRPLIVSKLDGANDSERAAAAARFRDVSEIDWLRRNLGREEVTVRWASMDALVRISPDAAIESLGNMQLGDLAMSRSRVLRPLMTIDPEGTTQRLVEIMRSNEDKRWIYAGLFDTSPEGMPAEVLDELLDSLQSSLGNREYEVLYRAFEALEGINEPNLLDRFSARAGTDLDGYIADLIIDPSGLSKDAQGLVPTSALKVLCKIAGPGLTRVVNHRLKTLESGAVREALALARLRPDEETRMHLRRYAVDQPAAHDPFWLRGAATSTLALIHAWRIIVEAYVAWHKENDLDVVEFRLGMGRLDDESMEPALTVLESDARNPGAIMALGFGHFEERTDEIAALLAAEGQTEEVVNACEYALFMMPTLTRDAEVALAAQARGEHGWTAIDALRNHGSQEGAALLLPIVEEAYDSPVPSQIGMDRVHALTSITRFALRSENVSERARLACLRLVSRGIARNVYADNLVHSLALHVRWNPEFEFLMRDPAVVDHLRQVAFGRDGRVQFVTHKLSAIRGLSVTAPEEAYAATLRVLRDPRAHDHKFSPYELLMYNEDRGKEDLFRHLLTEERVELRTYIGRALAEAGHSTKFLDRLNDVDGGVRRNAAFALGFGPYDYEVVGRLRELLEAEDGELGDECGRAIRRMQESSRAADLVRMFLEERDEARRWVILDAACDSGDPGGESRGLPSWAQPLVEEAEPALRSLVEKRFKKRQEAVRKDLEREDFRRRS